MGLQQRFDLLGIAGLRDRVAAALEGLAERAREGRVVLDDQQLAFSFGGFRHGFAFRSVRVPAASSSPSSSSSSSTMAASGSVMATMAPPSGRLCTATRPPRVRATLTTRNSPSPPPGRPLLDW